MTDQRSLADSNIFKSAQKKDNDRLDLVEAGLEKVNKVTYFKTFKDMGSLDAPEGLQCIQTAGHTVIGTGAALYVYDATINQAAVNANPDTMFMSKNGRGFTIAKDRLTICMFGAIGDGVTDDRPAIQRAIDWVSLHGGGTLIIPVGTYRLSWVLPADGGICCLSLKEGVSLVGENKYTSILKVMSNAGFGPGTYFRGITTLGRVGKVLLSNFTFDGNRSGQGLMREQGNGGNIVVDCSEFTCDGVRSIEANGNGIQLRGGPTNPVEVFSIINCYVAGCSGSTLRADGSYLAEYNGNGIGIQVAYAKDGRIVGNTVRSCKDNAIDTYNESGSYDAIGGGILITGNVLRSCRVGVFPETSSRTLVHDNYIEDMAEAGIALNRINSAPSMVTVRGNTIRTTLVGVRVSGNMESLVIDDNFIENITSTSGACIGLYTAANVLIKNNVFKTNNPDIPLIRTGDAQAVFCSIGENYFFGTPARDKMIYRTAADHFAFNVWGQFLPVNNGGVIPLGEGDAFVRNAGRFNSMALSGPFGANNAAPRSSSTLPIDATDLASSQALLNAMKAMLISYGLAKES